MTKAKTVPSDGPTRREYRRMSFATVRAAAAWCAKHPGAWFALNKRSTAPVIVYAQL